MHVNAHKHVISVSISISIHLKILRKFLLLNYSDCKFSDGHSRTFFLLSTEYLKLYLKKNVHG